MSPLQAHKPGRINIYHTAIEPQKYDQILMADETSKYDLSFEKDKITILDSDTKAKIRSFMIDVNHSGYYMFSSSACLSPDGRYICILETSKGIPMNTGTSSTTAESFSILKIYDENLVPPCGKIKLNGEIGKVVFSTDGKTFMVLNDGKALLYNSDTLEKMATLSSGNDPIMDVVYSPDNKYMVTGDGTRKIEIWDAKTGEHIKTLEEPRIAS